jgi:hypothetical protein
MTKKDSPFSVSNLAERNDQRRIVPRAMQKRAECKKCTEDADFYQRQLRLLRRMGRRAKRFGAKTLAPYGSAACSALARRYSLWRWIDARIEGKRNVYARSGLQSRTAEILSARSADPLIVHDLEAEALAWIQAGHSCAFDGAYID